MCCPAKTNPCGDGHWMKFILAASNEPPRLWTPDIETMSARSLIDPGWWTGQCIAPSLVDWIIVPCPISHVMTIPDATVGSPVNLLCMAHLMLCPVIVAAKVLGSQVAGGPCHARWGRMLPKVGVVQRQLGSRHSDFFAQNDLRWSLKSAWFLCWAIAPRFFFFFNDWTGDMRFPSTSIHSESSPCWIPWQTSPQHSLVSNADRIQWGTQTRSDIGHEPHRW